MESDNPVRPEGAIPADECFAGGGDMGERMRRHDWAETPLGPVAGWPRSLRTAVRILLNSRYPMFVWWGPRRVNLYNDAYVPVLGARHPDALGRPAPEVWREIWDTVGPQSDLVLEEGRATWDEELLLIMERHGYPEETYFTYSYSPVPDDDGSIGGLFCACTEDTQRVLGQRRLRTLRELSARTTGARTAEEACAAAAGVLAENPHDVPFSLLWLLDEEQRTARLVRASGIAPGGLAAPETVTLAAPGTPEAGWPLGEVLRRGTAVRVEDVQERFGALPGGPWPEPAPLAVALPIAHSAPGRTAGVLVAGVSPRRAFDDDYAGFFDLLARHAATAVATARAYEEERRRAESLAELDRAKTAFFSNVSHEFRTPLTLMLGPVDDVLADGDEPPTERQRERLEIAQRNALRLKRLVNTLLDFSRIEAGRVRASYRPTDLAALTAELASNFRAACERAGLELVVDCRPLSRPVHVDRDLWEKVVLNLVSNAFKYTLEGGIEVAVRERDGRAVLEVRDTGTGIPPDQLPRLFERFTRVEGARGRTQEGSGIGLALVRELVVLHGGEVAVESELGRGSTFRASLPFGAAHLPAEHVGAEEGSGATALGAAPYVEEALRWLPGEDGERPLPAAADEAAPSSPSPVPGGRPRVLLADDNADMRAYVRRLLADHYDVVAVGDGRAALASVREAPPDLVLTDVMMPGLDGFGLLAELRADPRTRDLPVLVLSARAGEEARVEGLEAGADDYLTKPFSAKELLASVRAHVRLARLRREAADSLRESEARFRNMADHAPVIIWVTDAAGSCTYLNAEWYRLTGSTPEESLGLGWLDALHPDDRERTRALFLGANGRLEPLRIEYRLRRRDGTYAAAIAAASPRRAGEFLGYVGSTVDVSDLKRVEAELLEQDRRKNEFLAVLAHELRNPLAPLRSALELVRGAARDPADVAEAHEVMDRQLRQMVRLVDDLLDTSRITRGRIEIRPEPVDLAAVVRSAVETSRPAVEEAGLALEVSLPDRPLEVEADPTRLAQVFSNLLNNAAKFTPTGGRVRIVVEPVGSDAVASVRDTGAGMPAELLPRVFDMFVQADRSLERAKGGLGIGLSLVRAIVELHGGTVEARSDGPGTGSEFVVRLPRRLAGGAPAAGPVAGPAAASAPPGASGRAASPRRVLVVDDNRDAAESLARLLALEGHDVRTAYDGSDALEAAEELRPELVLLDIGLPGLDGYEVARRLRARPWGGDVVLAALTGWGQEDDRRRSRDAGFDRHLVKPVEPETLAELLAPEGDGAGAGRG